MTEIDVVSTFGELNASVRSRFLRPLQLLQVDYTHHPFFRDSATVRSGMRSETYRIAESQQRLRRLATSKLDVLCLNREASPFSRGAIESRLLRAARIGVFSLDDALHIDFRRDVPSRVFSKPHKVTAAAKAADIVIAGNTFLADWSSQHAEDVRVIPTCVEASSYRQKTNFEISDPPQIVWIGTRSGMQYLNGIAPALQAVHKSVGARLTIISRDKSDVPLRLLHLVDHIPWRPRIAEDCLADFDFGIMPLRDSEYEKGKCAYKILEYGAASLPVLASPVGENHSILRASRNYVAGHSDWVPALMTIIMSSAQERAERGTSLRNHIVEKYDYSAHLETYRGILGLSAAA